jgi:hypothetical protein
VVEILFVSIKKTDQYAKIVVEVAFVSIKEYDQHVKNVVVVLFVNMTKYDHSAKIVVEAAFANIANNDHIVKFVVAHKFANMINNDGDAPCAGKLLESRHQSFFAKTILPNLTVLKKLSVSAIMTATARTASSICSQLTLVCNQSGLNQTRLRQSTSFPRNFHHLSGSLMHFFPWIRVAHVLYDDELTFAVCIRAYSWLLRWMKISMYPTTKRIR